MWIDIRSNAFRRLPREEQTRLLERRRRERDRAERARMTTLSQRPKDLRPRLKKDGAIV